MTNPMFNPQPNYSGVTIQIANPAVYAGQYDGKTMPCINGGCCGVNGNIPNNQNFINYPQASYAKGITPSIQENGSQTTNNMTNPNQNTGYTNAYPAQYYLNNYNYNSTEKANTDKEFAKHNNIPEQNNSVNTTNETYDGTNTYKIYAHGDTGKNNDLTKSKNIIGDIAEREAELEEKKKNTKETKIVALTDEYIKSLENYLNNPNDEIRLMASKEILTRLDEDKDRYDDAALNALLNKMLQDPNKLVRIAALSAFSSQLASGNNYTVKLLHNIQANPNADKEDILQAADILLKMSAGVEVKNIPNPTAKENK